MFDSLTPDKEKRIKIACLIVVALLVPSFVVYYEYEIASANNIQQMREHQIANTAPVTASNIGNVTNPTGTTP